MVWIYVGGRQGVSHAHWAAAFPALFLPRSLRLRRAAARPCAPLRSRPSATRSRGAGEGPSRRGSAAVSAAGWASGAGRGRHLGAASLVGSGGHGDGWMKSLVIGRAVWSEACFLSLAKGPAWSSSCVLLLRAPARHSSPTPAAHSSSSAWSIASPSAHHIPSSPPICSAAAAALAPPPEPRGAGSGLPLRRRLGGCASAGAGATAASTACGVSHGRAAPSLERLLVRNEMPNAETDETDGGFASPALPYAAGGAAAAAAIIPSHSLAASALPGCAGERIAGAGGGRCGGGAAAISCLVGAAWAAAAPRPLPQPWDQGFGASEGAGLMRMGGTGAASCSGASRTTQSAEPLGAAPAAQRSWKVRGRAVRKAFREHRRARGTGQPLESPTEESSRHPAPARKRTRRAS